MNKKTKFQLLLICLGLTFVIGSCKSENNKDETPEIVNETIDSSGIIKLIDFNKEREKIIVFDEIIADQIATVILTSKYGIENVWVQKSFEIELIQDSFWVVRGVLPENTPGGVAHIKIRREDGAILGVVHTK